MSVKGACLLEVLFPQWSDSCLQLTLSSRWTISWRKRKSVMLLQAKCLQLWKQVLRVHLVLFLKLSLGAESIFPCCFVSTYWLIWVHSFPVYPWWQPWCSFCLSLANSSKPPCSRSMLLKSVSQTPNVASCKLFWKSLLWHCLQNQKKLDMSS